MKSTFSKKTSNSNATKTNPKTTEMQENDVTVTDTETSEKVESKCEEICTKEQKPKKKTICISKMGSDHNFKNMNNQDFAFNLLNMKIVMDGCGSGKHSEVGVRIFAQLFARKAKEYLDNGNNICEENFIEVVNSIFEQMLELCKDISFIFQNYCFTILVCLETEDEFVVFSCGDGYIIKQNAEGITFDKLDDGEYPSYYIYNYIEDKSVLSQYKEGVEFKINRFPKSQYVNVGVASDGLRYCEHLLDVEKSKLIRFLNEGKGPAIAILINRNNRNNEMFHDDISICF